VLLSREKRCDARHRKREFVILGHWPIVDILYRDRGRLAPLRGPRFQCAETGRIRRTLNSLPEPRFRGVSGRGAFGSCCRSPCVLSEDAPLTKSIALIETWWRRPPLTGERKPRAVLPSPVLLGT
jgi:hypothetical protein